MAVNCRCAISVVSGGGVRCASVGSHLYLVCAWFAVTRCPAGADCSTDFHESMGHHTAVFKRAPHLVVEAPDVLPPELPGFRLGTPSAANVALCAQLRAVQQGCGEGQERNAATQECQPSPLATPELLWSCYAPHVQWYPCRSADACAGGGTVRVLTAVAAGTTNGTNSSCAAHQHGPLCELCDDGYVHGFDFQCVAMSDGAALAWAIASGLVVAVLCAGTAALVASTDARDKKKMCRVRCLRGTHPLALLHVIAGQGAVILPVVMFLQLATVLYRACGATWPTYIGHILHVLRFANGSLFWWVAMERYSGLVAALGGAFYAQMWVALVLPALLLATAFAAFKWKRRKLMHQLHSPDTDHRCDNEATHFPRKSASEPARPQGKRRCCGLRKSQAVAPMSSQPVDGRSSSQSSSSSPAPSPGPQPTQMGWAVLDDRSVATDAKSDGSAGRSTSESSEGKLGLVQRSQTSWRHGASSGNPKRVPPLALVKSEKRRHRRMITPRGYLRDCVDVTSLEYWKAAKLHDGQEQFKPILPGLPPTRWPLDVYYKIRTQREDHHCECVHAQPHAVDHLHCDEGHVHHQLLVLDDHIRGAVTAIVILFYGPIANTLMSVFHCQDVAGEMRLYVMHNECSRAVLAVANTDVPCAVHWTRRRFATQIDGWHGPFPQALLLPPWYVVCRCGGQCVDTGGVSHVCGAASWSAFRCTRCGASRRPRNMRWPSTWSTCTRTHPRAGYLPWTRRSVACRRACHRTRPSSSATGCTRRCTQLSRSHQGVSAAA